MYKVNESEVLIVDDSEDNRLILEALTRDLNYRSIMAINGKEAQEILKKQIPILLLLDINMPEMDGIELLKWIKSEERLKDLPVLMVSASDDSENIIQCLQLGAEDFIPKPFEPEILEARMNNALVRQKAKLTEKELLEKTFVGSVKVLSNLLTLLVPKIFGRVTRIQRYAKAIASLLDYDNIWEIELASLFSMVGTIMVPNETLEKIVQGKNLSPDERLQYDSHPTFGAKLLSNVPRLEKIAEVVKYQNWNPDLSKNENSTNLTSKESIPFGSHILRAAIEFESIQSRSRNPVEFIKYLHANEKHLEPEFLSAMEKTMYMDYSKDVKSLTIEQIKEGMVFAEDVFTKSDSKIIGQWQEVSEAFSIRLKQIHSKLGVKEPILMYVPKETQ